MASQMRHRVAALITIPALAAGLWLAGNAVANGAGQPTDQISDSAAPPLGIFCGNPNVTVNGVQDGSTKWQANAGESFSVSNLSVEAGDAKISSIQLVAGMPDANTQGEPVSDGSASLTVAKPGDVTVYAVVRFVDCRGNGVGMAQPIGDVTVK